MWGIVRCIHRNCASSYLINPLLAVHTSQG
jgi:hypothetical protein